MNPVRAYDAGPAIITSMIANTMGGARSKPADYMPYGKRQEDFEEVDGDTFLAALSQSAGVKDGNKRG